MSREMIQYREATELPLEQLLPLYQANAWSAAEKPETLRLALQSSHAVISAWDQERLVGLGNAISDGHLVVYYPHLLVHPQYQRRGIGREILRRLVARYDGFHQHMIVADGDAIRFYEKLGFRRAGRTEPMWIYDGNDH